MNTKGNCNKIYVISEICILENHVKVIIYFPFFNMYILHVLSFKFNFQLLKSYTSFKSLCKD